MRKASMSIDVCALEMMTVAVGSAEAFRDDSHGYRSMRAYSYGPPYGRSYFSGPRRRTLLPVPSPLRPQPRRY